MTVVRTRAMLMEILTASQAAGHLGPASVDAQITHTLGFSKVLAGAGPERAADLGSGGGVPGLVLAALAWPAARWTLIEARARRAAFLQTAVHQLGLHERVTVLQERAEVLGREAQHRGSYDVVTARSFGSPARVAECGAPLLRVGGTLIVSEPPEEDAVTAISGHRWPAGALASVGLGPPTFASGPPRLAMMRQVSPTAARYPRRAARLAKAPCF